MTGYLEAYPIDYYIKQQNLGNLYVLTESNGIVGAVVLLQEDSRWPDSEALPALYIHNLVTDSGIKGAGKRILRESEKWHLVRENVPFAWTVLWITHF